MFKIKTKLTTYNTVTHTHKMNEETAEGAQRQTDKLADTNR